MDNQFNPFQGSGGGVPFRHTVTQPTWNSDADMLELIKEEEARERKESKTTDAIQKAQGVIDERPVVASKRIGFWEEALKKQKQEVENSKKMMMVGSKPPTVNKGAMQPTTTPTFTKPPSANPNHLTAKTPETTIPVKPTQVIAAAVVTPAPKVQVQVITVAIVTDTKPQSQTSIETQQSPAKQVEVGRKKWQEEAERQRKEQEEEERRRKEMRLQEMRRAIEGKVEERPVVGVARVEAPTVATIVTAPPVVQEVKQVKPMTQTAPPVRKAQIPHQPTTQNTQVTHQTTPIWVSGAQSSIVKPSQLRNKTQQVAAQPPPPPPLVQKPAVIPTNKPPVTVPTPVTETKPSVKPVIEIESVTIVRPSQLKASLLRDHPEEKQNKPMPAPTTTLVQPVHHEPVPEPPKVITEVKVEAVVVEVQKIQVKPEVKVEVPAQPPPVVEAKPAVVAQPVQKKTIIEPVKPAQSQQPVQQQEPARPATGIVKLADRIKMFQSVTQVAPVHNPVVVPKHQPKPVTIESKQQPPQQPASQQPQPPQQPHLQKKPDIFQLIAQIQSHNAQIKQAKTAHPILYQQKKFQKAESVATDVHHNKQQILLKIKDSINSDKVKTANMAGLWEKQLQKLNSEVAKSKESWEQFNRSRGSGPGAAASEPSSPMKEGSAVPVGPKLHHTVSITEVPDEQELGKQKEKEKPIGMLAQVHEVRVAEPEVIQPVVEPVVEPITLNQPTQLPPSVDQPSPLPTNTVQQQITDEQIMRKIEQPDEELPPTVPLKAAETQVIVEKTEQAEQKAVEKITEVTQVVTEVVENNATVEKITEVTEVTSVEKTEVIELSTKVVVEQSIIEQKIVEVTQVTIEKDQVVQQKPVLDQITEVTEVTEVAEVTKVTQVSEVNEVLEVVEANSTVEIANKPVEVQETTPVELVQPIEGPTKPISEAILVVETETNVEPELNQQVINEDVKQIEVVAPVQDEMIVDFEAKSQQVTQVQETKVQVVEIKESQPVQPIQPTELAEPTQPTPTLSIQQAVQQALLHQTQPTQLTPITSTTPHLLVTQTIQRTVIIHKIGDQTTSVQLSVKTNIKQQPLVENPMGLKTGDVLETATVTLEVERPEGVKEISQEEREGIMGEVMQVVEDGVKGREVKEEVLAIGSEGTVVVVEEEKKGIEGTLEVVEEERTPVVEVAVVAQEVVEIPQQIAKEEVIVQPAVIIETKALIIEAEVKPVEEIKTVQVQVLEPIKESIEPAKPVEPVEPPKPIGSVKKTSKLLEQALLRAMAPKPQQQPQPQAATQSEHSDLGSKTISQTNMLGSRKKMKKTHSNFDDL